jgi:Zn-dependent peptidase ImmA (M78 family)
LLTEGHEPLQFIGSASESTPADEVARSIQQTLGISTNDQVACDTRRDALNLWIERTEASGIYVCREGKVDSEEARGVALTDDIAPFIYVNSNDSYSARLFTLLHELAHLWINKPGLSNLEGITRQAKSGIAAIEAFCNRVAAQSLMSEHQFTTLWDARDSSHTQTNQIDAIADHFNVSGEVVARRLLDRRVIRAIEYEKLREFFYRRWLKHKDEEKKKQKQSKGGPSFYLQRLHSNGRSFTQTVLGACHAGSVSLRDACAVLNVKVGHLPKLAETAGMKQPPVVGGTS